jgi:predicted DNA-binding ribbon-helix-helix protein
MTLKKRSFSLAGHRTSVALEPEFWTVIEAGAAREGKALAALVAQIDASRDQRPLASALRLYALALKP